MPFTYSDRPHVRKHGPGGYTDYARYKPWLRDEFSFRCVYCLQRERWYPNGHAGFGVEHVKPKARPEYQDLICDYRNLVYACNRCNSLKRDAIVLDPCETSFSSHIRVSADGQIRGLTPHGCDLVDRLGLDEIGPKSARRECLRVLRLFQKQPADPEVRALYLHYFGFPEDLPDLDVLRPEINARPAGLAEAYFRQRRDGRLAETYF